MRNAISIIIMLIVATISVFAQEEWPPNPPNSSNHVRQTTRDQTNVWKNNNCLRTEMVNGIPFCHKRTETPSRRTFRSFFLSNPYTERRDSELTNSIATNLQGDRRNALLSTIAYQLRSGIPLRDIRKCSRVYVRESGQSNDIPMLVCLLQYRLLQWRNLTIGDNAGQCEYTENRE